MGYENLLDAYISYVEKNNKHNDYDKPLYSRLLRQRKIVRTYSDEIHINIEELINEISIVMDNRYRKEYNIPEISNMSDVSDINIIKKYYDDINYSSFGYATFIQRAQTSCYSSIIIEPLSFYLKEIFNIEPKELIKQMKLDSKYLI